MTRFFPHFAFLAVAFFAAAASASVSFLVQADRLTDANGNNFSGGMTYLLVVDKSGDGFAPIQAGATTTPGSIISGTDDVVIYRGAIAQDSSTTGASAGHDYASNSTGNITYSTFGIAANEKIEIVWFPTVSSSSNAALTGGTSYGSYTQTVTKDGVAPFLTPNDPTSNDLVAFYTTDARDVGPNSDGSGSSSPSVGRASLVVVPEPNAATLLFAALALAGIFWRPRQVAYARYSRR